MSVRRRGDVYFLISIILNRSMHSRFLRLFSLLSKSVQRVNLVKQNFKLRYCCTNAGCSSTRFLQEITKKLRNDYDYNTRLFGIITLSTLGTRASQDYYHFFSSFSYDKYHRRNSRGLERDKKKSNVRLVTSLRQSRNAFVTTPITPF